MAMYVGTPQEYTPLDYIESSGHQWINTEYCSNSNTKIELQVKFNNASTQEALYNARDYNGSDNINNFNAFKGINGNSFRVDFGTVGSNFSHSVNTTTVYTYIQDRNKFYENGTLIYTGSTATFTTSNPMTLFASYYNGKFANMGNLASYKLYYCKIWDNDVLVRDFIPVLDHHNVACLYEKIENLFYYNKGSGTFTPGIATGQTVIGESKARAIQQAFVGISGVARKIKKGYVGVNGVARRFYWHFPYAYMPEADSGIVKTYVGNDYGIAKTADYIITVGGRRIANTNMNTTASEALNADGVLTTITNHAMRMPGGMEVNGNAVFCCGNSSTSTNSGSNAVVSYSNDLVKTSLSNFGTAAYGVFPAANSVHGIRMGGNGYSTARSTVDILNNNLVRTSGTSLTNARKANGTAAVGNYILTAAGSSSGNSSGGALKTVEAYDNNNVKTSATSLAEAAWYKTGISTKKYAIFYGGRLTNENGKSTNNFSYFNENLVLTTMEFPYSCYNGVGLQIDDFILIGSGDTMETARGSAIYHTKYFLFTEDLVRIKEEDGPADASWTQRRYQLLGNRLYYEGYKTGFSYLKY